MEKSQSESQSDISHQIYTDQIEKLTKKLMEYKRRIKGLEKEGEARMGQVASDKEVESEQEYDGGQIGWGGGRCKGWHRC